jgi:hypothetical protein
MESEHQRLTKSGHLSLPLNNEQPSAEPVIPTRNSPLGTSVELLEHADDCSLFRQQTADELTVVRVTREEDIISMFRSKYLS